MTQHRKRSAFWDRLQRNELSCHPLSDRDGAANESCFGKGLWMICLGYAVRTCAIDTWAFLPVPRNVCFFRSCTFIQNDCCDKSISVLDRNTKLSTEVGSMYASSEYHRGQCRLEHVGQGYFGREKTITERNWKLHNVLNPDHLVRCSDISKLNTMVDNWRVWNCTKHW